MKTLRSEGSFINLLPTSAFHTKLRVTVESTIANLERNLTMNVTTASTAELLAFYNANATKPVARFSDRNTAERRVNALLVIMTQAAVRPKDVQEKKPAVDRSAAIAASWTDKRVAAARATRHAVRVTDPRGGQGSYKSVREAFMVLALPLGQHIKFRGALKAAGKGEFSGFKFKLVERQ